MNMKWMLNIPNASPEQLTAVKQEIEEIGVDDKDKFFMILFSGLDKFQLIDTEKQIAYNYDGKHISISEVSK